MYDFDEEIRSSVARHKVKYTRYADDLTFSADRTGYLNSVDGILRKIIAKSKSPKLKINEEKTVLATSKVHRQITGLVLTLDGKISIGKNSKRIIRSSLFHYKNGTFDENLIPVLSGYMAHIWSVEREFYFRMQKHYGKEVFDRLFHKAE